jgi:hypothetical protein
MAAQSARARLRESPVRAFGVVIASLKQANALAMDANAFKCARLRKASYDAGRTWCFQSSGSNPDLPPRRRVAPVMSNCRGKTISSSATQLSRGQVCDPRFGCPESGVLPSRMHASSRDWRLRRLRIHHARALPNSAKKRLCAPSAWSRACQLSERSKL